MYYRVQGIDFIECTRISDIKGNGNQTEFRIGEKRGGSRKDCMYLVSTLKQTVVKYIKREKDFYVTLMNVERLVKE